MHPAGIGPFGLIIRNYRYRNFGSKQRNEIETLRMFDTVDTNQTVAIYAGRSN